MFKNKFKLAIICGVGCMLVANILSASIFENSHMLTDVEMEAIYGGTGADENCLLANDKGCEDSFIMPCIWGITKCCGTKYTTCKQDQFKCKDWASGSCTDKSTACTGKYRMFHCVGTKDNCYWDEGSPIDCYGTKMDC